MKFSNEDYLYCKDCETYVDLWMYASVEDTGHGSCNWRFVTDEELIECVKDCKEEGCFQEV